MKARDPHGVRDKKALLLSRKSESLPRQPTSRRLTLIRFLVQPPGGEENGSAVVADDDAAEGAAHVEQPRGGERGKKKEKSRGQNTNRKFGASRDEVGLCASRANSPEFSPAECRFGDSCKFEHDLRKYLKDWKREDLTTFHGVCPIWCVYMVPFSTYFIYTQIASRAPASEGSPFPLKSDFPRETSPCRDSISQAKRLRVKPQTCLIPILCPEESLTGSFE